MSAQRNELINFLKFESEEVRQLFNKAVAKEGSNQDLFRLFLQSNQAVSEEKLTQIESDLQALASDVSSNKKFIKRPDKRAELIHAKLHSTLFKKYVINALPEMIADSGRYNCVTGSAYAFYLAHLLDIHCVIKEEPQHVFPILEIEGVKYSIETTDGLFGGEKYPPNYKESIIQQLKVVKLIAEDEYVGMSNSEIFTELYELRRTISFLELVALQYSNQAIFDMANNDLASALFNSCKAYVLLPDPKIELSLISILSLYLNDPDYSDSSYIDALKILASFNTTKYAKVLINPIYSQFTMESLINSDNLDRFVEVQNYFRDHSSDSLLQADLDFVSSAGLSDYYSVRGQFDLSLKHSHLALLHKPGQTQLLENHIGLMVNSLQAEGASEENIAMFLKTAEEFPDIKKLHNYKVVGASMLCDKLVNELESNSVTGVKNWLKKLEAFIEDVDGGVSNEILAEMYKQVSVFNFKKGRMGDAYKYINKALTLMPNDYSLKKLKAIYAS